MTNNSAEEKTHKQTVLEIINSLPIPENFSIPSGFPIPIGSNIILLPNIPKDIKLESGLIVPPGSSKKKNFTGTIYSMGEDVTVPVRPGLTVDYEEHGYSAQSELNFKGQQYMIIGQHMIRAICTPGSFKYPKYPNTEEIRRQNRMDEQSQVRDSLQKKVDNLDEKAPK